jgi:hypothetical protein
VLQTGLMKSLGSWNVRVDPGDKLYRIRGGESLLYGFLDRIVHSGTAYSLD